MTPRTNDHEDLLGAANERIQKMAHLAHATAPGWLGRRHGVKRWIVSFALLACLATGTLHFAPQAGATPSGVAATCAAATRVKPIKPLTSFPAIALPAGSSTGAPAYIALPAGYKLKHTHGGPTYVYVISGDIKITDNSGSITYCTGSFFSEPPGHVHTLQVVQPSELFVLQFLPPGADGTIPVQ